MCTKLLMAQLSLNVCWKGCLIPNWRFTLTAWTIVNFGVQERPSVAVQRAKFCVAGWIWINVMNLEKNGYVFAYFWTLHWDCAQCVRAVVKSSSVLADLRWIWDNAFGFLVCCGRSGGPCLNVLSSMEPSCPSAGLLTIHWPGPNHQVTDQIHTETPYTEQ